MHAKIDSVKHSYGMVETGIMGDVGFAFPLTREIANPLNGQRNGPRLMMQLGYVF